MDCLTHCLLTATHACDPPQGAAVSGNGDSEATCIVIDDSDESDNGRAAEEEALDAKKRAATTATTTTTTVTAAVELGSLEDGGLSVDGMQEEYEEVGSGEGDVSDSSNSSNFEQDVEALLAASEDEKRPNSSSSSINGSILTAIFANRRLFPTIRSSSARPVPTQSSVSPNMRISFPTEKSNLLFLKMKN